MDTGVTRVIPGPRGADRAPDGADQRADRPLQVPRQGSPLPPRAAALDRAASRAPRIPQAHRNRALPPDPREARASAVDPGSAGSSLVGPGRNVTFRAVAGGVGPTVWLAASGTKGWQRHGSRSLYPG